jgi:hypothetical protein
MLQEFPQLWDSGILEKPFAVNTLIHLGEDENKFFFEKFLAM